VTKLELTGSSVVLCVGFFAANHVLGLRLVGSEGFGEDFSGVDEELVTAVFAVVVVASVVVDVVKVDVIRGELEELASVVVVGTGVVDFCDETATFGVGV
jgi:hypothetical protein